MARRGVLGMLVGGAAALLSGCGALLGRDNYKFKMTVEVDTPEGLRSGSSVYFVRAWRTTELITGGSSSDTELRGEAVVVDLPGGKTLFALLKIENPRHQDLPTMSMKTLDPAFNFDRKVSAERIANKDGIISPAEVSPEYYPLLVTFSDLTDPTSVARVDPLNLAASFGPGVKLKRIMVAVTDEAVTTGIGMRLGWLEAHRGTLKPSPPAYMDDPRDLDLRLLGKGPFSTELVK